MGTLNNFCPRGSWYTDFVKNMTITVDDDTARWARIEAARSETSVSRLVGNLLREHMMQQMGYEKAMEHYLSRSSRALKPSKANYPSRQELYERASLR